jgi:hypothetical protein
MQEGEYAGKRLALHQRKLNGTWLRESMKKEKESHSTPFISSPPLLGYVTLHGLAGLIPSATSFAE